jgi:hypothetical protein
MLRQLQKAFISLSKTKGQWTPAEFIDLNNILFIPSYHKKLSINIQLGLNETAFFLNIQIPQPENIPNMADSFWLKWLQLGKLGDFTFEENEVVSIHNDPDFKYMFLPNAGNLFRLIRNFIVYQALNNETIDLGSIRFEWRYDQYPITEIITKAGEAFNKVFRLNEILVSRSYSSQ